ncbi:hypothetical protein C0993_002628 [Termitomyces sp. T159_Od127]|nr:hypothetical protein C0993_002628 [Termitomyces sp. T159_Od127]
MVTSHSSTRRLGLVFFDILSINSKSLLMTPYRTRRSILESLIHVVPGECILSHRVPVGIGSLNYGEDSQVIALETIFAESVASYQEGLVLKGEETVYHDFSTPWVKIKRDYIPRYGDAVDMVVVGVTWERERGRVLRGEMLFSSKERKMTIRATVPPSTMTTFYIGGLDNSDEIRRQKVDTLPYTFTLLQGLAPPRYILKEPLLAELYGAGFTKAPKSRHYELRFPRVTKIHRPSDRPWTEGINLKDLHKIACAVVGRDTSIKEARDITAEMWGIPASPGAHSASKRKAAMDLWREKFAALDGRVATGDNARHSPSLSPSSALVVTSRDADSEAIYFPPTKKRRICQEEVRSDILVASQSSQEVKGPPQPLKVKTNIVLNQPMLSSGLQQSQSPILEIPRSPPLTPQKPPLKPTNRVGHGSPPVLVRPTPVRTPIASKPSSRFLKNALVWFAKPSGESWVVRNVVPREQRVHSVEAFLAGCGWCTNSLRADWVEKGVIFVDKSTLAGKDIARRALEMIDERLLVLPLDQPRKRIWIFDQKRWTMDDETVTKSHALYRYD